MGAEDERVENLHNLAHQITLLGQYGTKPKATCLAHYHKFARFFRPEMPAGTSKPRSTVAKSKYAAPGSAYDTTATTTMTTTTARGPPIVCSEGCNIALPLGNIHRNLEWGSKKQRVSRYRGYTHKVRFRKYTSHGELVCWLTCTRVQQSRVYWVVGWWRMGGWLSE